MTIPRLELGISRVSGERVSHCTIQSHNHLQTFATWNSQLLMIPKSWSNLTVDWEKCHLRSLLTRTGGYFDLDMVFRERVLKICWMEIDSPLCLCLGSNPKCRGSWEEAHPWRWEVILEVIYIFLLPRALNSWPLLIRIWFALSVGVWLHSPPRFKKKVLQGLRSR